MQNRLSTEKWEEFKKIVGEPIEKKLREWLKAFENPKEAVKKEVNSLKKAPYIPEDIIIHGLVYDLSTGNLEVIVNGYK